MARPEHLAGLHRVECDEDELIDALLEDVLEGLELRLAFEAWADARDVSA